MGVMMAVPSWLFVTQGIGERLPAKPHDVSAR
jgi:hypothetical protein